MGHAWRVSAQHTPQRRFLPDQHSRLAAQQRDVPCGLRQHGGWGLLRFGPEEGMGQSQVGLPERIPAEPWRRVLRRKLAAFGLPRDRAIGHGERGLAPVIVISFLSPAVAPGLILAIASEGSEIVLEDDPLEL